MEKVDYFAPEEGDSYLRNISLETARGMPTLWYTVLIIGAVSYALVC